MDYLHLWNIYNGHYYVRIYIYISQSDYTSHNIAKILTFHYAIFVSETIKHIMMREWKILNILFQMIYNML